MLKRTVKWGVVQELCVEADTDDSLTAAMTIALSYFHASHFSVGTDKAGTAYLDIGGGGSNTTPFLTPIVEPAELATAVKGWLEGITYPTPDSMFDGTLKKGWRVTAGGPSWKATFRVEPVWILYGK